MGAGAVAVLVTLACVYVLIHDRVMSMWTPFTRKFLLVSLSMPFGTVAAVAFVQVMTLSHLRDMGGPVDRIVRLGVAVMGAIGLAIVVYKAHFLLRGTQD